MINDYNEFCDYIKLIYNKEYDKLKQSNYLNRMLNILARRFVFPYSYLEEDNKSNSLILNNVSEFEKATSFKNDFYDLLKPEYDNKLKNFKKRLTYSTSAIKYLYTGIYDNAMKSKDKFIKYLKHDLKDVPYGNELIDKYENGERGFNPENLLDWKIYNANRDAVILGPLRKNIGVKYTVDEFNLMLDLSLKAENKNRDDNSNIMKITIMLMSYYKFYKSKRNCKYVPFMLETMKTWYTPSGHNWFNVREREDSDGFQATGLLNLENKLLEKENGMYASDSELTKKINPEFIVLREDQKETYLTEDKQYVVFVDQGQDTYKNIGAILENIIENLNE